MVNIKHQAELAKKSLDKQRKFDSGWYEKRITRLEEKLGEAEADNDRLQEALQNIVIGKLPDVSGTVLVNDTIKGYAKKVLGGSE